MSMNTRVATVLRSSVVVGAMVLSGFASSVALAVGATSVTVTDPNRLTQSGFLSDYARLAPTDWGNGIECWREPNLNAQQYDKLMISRILVSLKPQDGKEVTVDPSDLKMLTDYFHDSLVAALESHMQIVSEPSAGTLVMRIQLTSLVPTQVSRSVVGTLIPYGFVAEAGSGRATGRPAGSTPYLGETGMEMQFVDGVSGAVLAECRDTEVGRKYAADLDSGAAGVAKTWATGYLNSFQAWSYAKNAFDKWSLLVAERIEHLRGN